MDKYGKSIAIIFIMLLLSFILFFGSTFSSRYIGDLIFGIGLSLQVLFMLVILFLARIVARLDQLLENNDK
ncbi:MAG: hypothetical protein ACRC1M_04930 [Methanobacteriaceae archaeon]